MKLFISYSRDDKAWVYDLANRLKDEYKYQVWIDRLLVGGDTWWNTILDEIEGAECVIAILSPKAVDSIYCEAELNYALALNKPVLPLLLKPCDVPTELREIQYEDLTNTDSLDKVVVKCGHAFNRIEQRLIRGEFVTPSVPPKRPSVPEAKKAEHSFELFQAMDEAIRLGNLAVAHKLCTQIEQVDPEHLGLAAKERLVEAQREQERAKAYSVIGSLVAAKSEASAKAAWGAFVGKYGTEYDPNGYAARWNHASEPNVPLSPDPLEPKTVALVFFKRGQARAAKGDKDGAFSDYSEAIRLDPNFADAYFNRGMNHFFSRDYDEALNDIGKAIRLDPYNIGNIFMHGHICTLDGYEDEALDDFTEIIRLNPKMAAAYSSRGAIRARKGDSEGALADYTEAIRLDPDDAQTYYLRSTVYITIGGTNGALADLSEAIRLEPDDAQAYCDRAYIRSDKKDFSGAVADAMKYLELAPDHSDAPKIRASLTEWQQKV